MGARLLVLAKFCNCLSNARARKNKHSARMLADARKDHSIPLLRDYPNNGCEGD